MCIRCFSIDLPTFVRTTLVLCRASCVGTDLPESNPPVLASIHLVRHRLNSYVRLYVVYPVVDENLLFFFFFVDGVGPSVVNV